jgi:hypothetical protein
MASATAVPMLDWGGKVNLDKMKEIFASKLLCCYTLTCTGHISR